MLVPNTWPCLYAEHTERILSTSTFFVGWGTLLGPNLKAPGQAWGNPGKQVKIPGNPGTFF